MTPAIINLLGDDFHLFSLRENAHTSMACDSSRGAVILGPSLAADFFVKACSSEHYAAAVCAAAFLVLKRGLPLSEILFETPNGNIEILCTGGGEFAVTIPKCKLLSTKAVTISGCDLRFLDVSLLGRHRVVYTKNIDNFDVSLCPRLVSAAEPVPDSVTVFSASDGVLDVYSYAAHAPMPPSRLTAVCAAAYCQRILNKMPSGSEIILRGGEASLLPSYSSVLVRVKPAI